MSELHSQENIYMERLPLDTEIQLDDGRWVLAATYPQYDATKHYPMRSGNETKIAELQAWKEAEQAIIMQNAQLLVAAGCKSARIPDAIKELISDRDEIRTQRDYHQRINAELLKINGRLHAAIKQHSCSYKIGHPQFNEPCPLCLLEKENINSGNSTPAPVQ